MLAYSSRTTFSWEDKYEIAASDISYKEGGCQFFPRISFIETDLRLDLTQATTVSLPITSTENDAFVLKDWSKCEVKRGTSWAPENGFAFQPSKDIKGRGASAIAYLTSPAGGTEIPQHKVPCELFQVSTLSAAG